MKMPLWARNREGKIEQFPYHLLETLSDGTLGFKFTSTENPDPKNLYFGKFRNHFEWNPIGTKRSWELRCEYRLRDQ